MNGWLTAASLKLLLALVSPVLLAVPCEAAAPKPLEKPSSKQTLILVSDCRGQQVKWDMSDARPKLSDSEHELLKETILPAARTFWKKHYPEGVYENFRPLTAFRGSFTESGVDQRLILYQYEPADNTGKYGIVVLQGGRQVCHYGFEDCALSNFRMLPDLNENGCSELAFDSWSMHQGYRHGAVLVITLGAKDMKPLGWTEIADDDLNTNRCFKFVITARRGTLPQFYSQRYQKVRDKWTSKGKQQAIKLSKQDTEYKLVK